MALSPKQTAFIREYLIDLNGTQAAIRAGYSAKTAESQGSRLLRNVKIRKAVDAANQKRQERVELTADYVLRNLAEVVERCMQRARVMEFDHESKSMVQVTDEEGRAVWEFNSNGATRGLELLGKHLKLFTEKHEHSFNEMTDEQLEARYLALMAKASEGDS